MHCYYTEIDIYYKYIIQITNNMIANMERVLSLSGNLKVPTSN